MHGGDKGLVNRLILPSRVKKILLQVGNADRSSTLDYRQAGDVTVLSSQLLFSVVEI